MAEEGTLGLARATDQPAEELSKEELQRRLDETRDSISNTVTEIKETVAQKVQVVKESLDWREQFRRRPVAWSVGALGVGFIVGYGIAAAAKDDEDDSRSAPDYYRPQRRSYAAQPIIAAAQHEQSELHETSGHNEERGPSLLQKLTNTPAYERVRSEAGSLGDAFVTELSNTAKQLVIPALIKSLRDFVGGVLPANQQTKTARKANANKETSYSYEPRLERS
jgi:hypothetical protein